MSRSRKSFSYLKFNIHFTQSQINILRIERVKKCIQESKEKHKEKQKNNKRRGTTRNIAVVCNYYMQNERMSIGKTKNNKSSPTYKKVNLGILK